MFEKKFRVRISLYSRDYYTVEYAHYRFIPFYTPLCFWFEQTLTGGTECWSTRLFKVKEAEEVANNIRSIEDVSEYHKPEHIKRNDFYARKNEYYKNQVPYKSKQIL